MSLACTPHCPLVGTPQAGEPPTAKMGTFLPSAFALWLKFIQLFRKHAWGPSCVPGATLKAKVRDKNLSSWLVALVFGGPLPDGLQMKLSHSAASTPLGLSCPSLDIHNVRGPQADPRPVPASVSSLLTTGSQCPVPPVTIRVGKGPFPRSQAWPFLMSMNCLGKGLANRKMDKK